MKREREGRGVGLLCGDRYFKQFACEARKEPVAAGRFWFGKVSFSMGFLSKSIGREGAVGSMGRN